MIVCTLNPKYAGVISLFTDNDFLPRSYRNNSNGREIEIDLPSAGFSGLGLDGIMIISAVFSGMGLERLTQVGLIEAKEEK